MIFGQKNFNKLVIILFTGSVIHTSCAIHTCFVSSKFPLILKGNSFCLFQGYYANKNVVNSDIYGTRSFK